MGSKKSFVVYTAWKSLSKKSFVVYTAWKSFFELLDDPVLVKELLFAVFSLAEGEEVVITNNKVRTAFNAIEPTMKEDLEAYKAKCEKNRAAAQSRWSNPDGMRSHADAVQRDGDNDYDYVNDNDYDNESDNDIDMTVMSGQDVPTVADVIEASKNRRVDMSEEEAKAFLEHYYGDLKGEIKGEPIRNWRKLLKSWDNHTLVEPETVMGSGYEGYQNVYCRLPVEVQRAVDKDQEQFEAACITARSGECFVTTLTGVDSVCVMRNAALKQGTMHLSMSVLF